ncbi:PIG-L deacetylase family protein [Propylenella binzhouense]|uniref:PIG-L family deacetylase n=1 Tax=Propylenella binzhouense TaxID=2555902 RepID=A0A964T2B5_9HYPH|nr:PIG-L deacetylase family protein [Propylenella binzhouense]MYZ47070.1 PIG-L family deacetylase [Propylenella binzhouense]
MRIIGFGAHPDDAEIYFLGLMLAARARGDEIGWTVATDGARGGAGDRDLLAARRRHEAIAAAGLAGVAPRFLGREDGGLAADGELAGLLAAEIGALAPDLVVTHALNDYHPDHRALAAAVVTAAAFDVPVLHADTMAGAGFEPTHYVDVTAAMATKRAAIRMHESQRPERFVEMAETLNRLRAMQCHGPAGTYAEAYRFAPRFPFADIRDLLPPAPLVRPFGGGNPRADP